MKQKKKWPVVAAVIVVLIVVFAALGAGRDAEPRKVAGSGDRAGDQANTQAATTAEGKTKFTVGDTAELNGVQVTLLSVEEVAPSAYFQPSDGNVFIACEFEIANQSQNEIAVSSMISFEAYCDDYAVNQSLSALSSVTQSGKKQLDGTINSGKKMNGCICYEVAQDWQKMEISYSPSFWGKAMTFEAAR